MKKQLLVLNVLIVAIIFFSELRAQQLLFESRKHNFGYLQRGEIDTMRFKFKNDGKAPLIITDAKFECSCTSVNFPTDSIFPGKEGVIEVIYNSKGAIGLQDRHVTVISNSRKGNEKIHFRGEVLNARKLGF